MSLNSTEHVTSTSPFTVRRRVRFGDCDPAGIFYTAMFAEYVLSAEDLFLSTLMGRPMSAFVEAFGIGTPMKAISFVFSSVMRPDDEFELVVTVAEIRRSTFDLVMTANIAGRLTFEATATPICVTVGGERKSAEIPAVLRERLEAYQRSGRLD